MFSCGASSTLHLKRDSSMRNAMFNLIQRIGQSMSCVEELIRMYKCTTVPDLFSQVRRQWQTSGCVMFNGLGGSTRATVSTYELLASLLCR